MKQFWTMMFLLLWGFFCIGGTAYLVFWMGQSGWWFLLAIVIFQIPLPDKY